MKPWYLRAFLWLYAKVFYRIAVVGPERVPVQGGALLVSNHVSFVDMLLILASTGRFVRFLVSQEELWRWWLQPVLRRLKVIALPEERRTAELEAALKQASEAIRSGEVVGIFAEKSISRIGLLLPFGRELERIMSEVEAPIIPVCLDGVWGSIFSYHAGRFFWKLPRRLPYPVSVSFGSPLSSKATAGEVRGAIQTLNTEAWHFRRRTMKPLGRTFVETARHHPLRFAWADGRVAAMNFGSALAKTMFVARRLSSQWRGQKMVGIFLPPSVGGALANFAAFLLGKAPVNLNYTLSAEALGSCARQCDLQTILTSKTFLARAKVTLPCRTLLLEEVVAKPSQAERLMAFLLAWFCPVGWVRRFLAGGGLEESPRASSRSEQPPAEASALSFKPVGELDELATVVFSSGSTGEPKGIMLSHYNLISNIAQMGQTFDFGARDRFLGILPFFHSFGFTATLLAPAVNGLGVVFHANPLEGKVIGELARRYGATYLMATPAFLQIYLRTCEPGDFGSLRVVLAGAEKLPEWLVTAFEEKFGIRPVEGYGCTECSPVVAANTHDYRAAGVRQLGSHRGKIGHPLPGMSVRIIDPETGALLAAGHPGLLVVRGPNVMQGYLNLPAKTAEVLREGWFYTGDIATLDDDGFLQITDRLSRFSKIGGEMVPHIKIEEKLHELAEVNELTFVVTGVPDERKGERLVVLHRLGEEALGRLLQRLPQLNLPNLWVPKPNQFFAVQELPLLASGKLDLRKIREEAQRLSRRQEPAARFNSPTDERG